MLLNYVLSLQTLVRNLFIKYIIYYIAAEPPAPEDPCTMAPDAGTGDEKAQRFYYDPKTKECNKFKYGGSGGNSNNFKNRDACIEACGDPLPGM